MSAFYDVFWGEIAAGLIVYAVWMTAIAMAGWINYFQTQRDLRRAHDGWRDTLDEWKEAQQFFKSLRPMPPFMEEPRDTDVTH